MITKQPRRISKRERRASCCWFGICTGGCCCCWAGCMLDMPVAVEPRWMPGAPAPPNPPLLSGKPCKWKPKREGNNPNPAESVILPKRAVAAGPAGLDMKLNPWCEEEWYDDGVCCCCCDDECCRGAVSGLCPAGRCGMLIIITPGTALVRGSTQHPTLPLPYNGITLSSSTLALHTGHSWQMLCIWSHW